MLTIHKFLVIGTIGLTLSLQLPLIGTATAQAVAAQPALTPSQATELLLANAQYWRSRGQPAVAQKELERILSYSPRNADVIAAAAEVAFDRSDYDAADRYRAMLTAVAPNDPRNRTLAAEHQRTPQEDSALATARQLVREGKPAEAVAGYNEVFHGAVPPSLAIEYYGVLGSSSQAGFDEAEQKLGAIATQRPDDKAVQLSYARLLSLHEDTRNEGIRMLAAMSGAPGVGRAARETWHEVLTWLGPSEKARSQVQAYLKLYPDDAALVSRLRSFDETLPSASVMAVNHAYYDMEKDPAKAEQGFREALRTDPNNTDALVMLAARLRATKHLAEAEIYLNRALAIAPQKRAEFLVTVGGEYKGILPITLEDRVMVVSLTSAGKYEQAQTLLARLYQGRETASTYVQIGEIQLRAGQLDTAAKNFQKARTMSPKNGDGVCGLATVSQRQGRPDDARMLYTEAATLYAKANSPLGLGKVDAGRAELLQDQAMRLGSDARIKFWQDALTADARNIYIRVDLARVLQSAGKSQEADAVITKGSELQPSRRQALQAAASAAGLDLRRDHDVQTEISVARRASLVNFYSSTP